MDTALFSGRKRKRLARLKQDRMEVIPVKFQTLELATLFGRSTGMLLPRNIGAGHPGLDLATDFRQPIFASDSGTVVFSGWDNTGYGVMVIIDHGNGYQTYYSHNEANLVSAGQTVAKGQQIAESGNTGNSTGNHVDFRILLNGTFLNPLGYLP